jgi:hypothetical protein
MIRAGKGLSGFWIKKDRARWEEDSGPVSVMGRLGGG